MPCIQQDNLQRFFSTSLMDFIADFANLIKKGNNYFLLTLACTNKIFHVEKVTKLT